MFRHQFSDLSLDTFNALFLLIGEVVVMT
jgi:hypothetical protein